jgi:hypothetical protein
MGAKSTRFEEISLEVSARAPLADEWPFEHCLSILDSPKEETAL